MGVRLRLALEAARPRGPDQAHTAGTANPRRQAGSARCSRSRISGLRLSPGLPNHNAPGRSSAKAASSTASRRCARKGAPRPGHRA